jgi:hypothetical protein
MRPTRSQLLPLILLLICMFGCKGAGTALRVLGAVAVTTVRVVAVAGALAAHDSRVHAREAAQTAEGQRRAEEAAAYADREQRSGRCTELVVEVVPPPPPGSPPAPRGFDCGGRVLLQNPEGGWRDYDVEGAPTVVPP